MSNISGLNWTTTSVINDMNYEHGVGGKRVWPLKGGDNGNTTIGFAVAGVGNFYNTRTRLGGQVIAIRTAVPVSGALAEATLDFGNETLEGLMNVTDETHTRRTFKLAVYIGVEPRLADPFVYSNSYALKGIPFALEFTVRKDATAKEIADEIERIAKINKIFQVGTEQLTITNNGAGKLTFKCKESWQRLRQIVITSFNPFGEHGHLITAYVESREAFDDGSTKTQPEDPDAIGFSDLVKGEAEFGTYNQLISDLRLPTIENRRWMSENGFEQPIPGATYKQYIFTLCSPSNNGGVAAVGQRMLSETTHIFWVKQDQVSAFEAVALGDTFKTSGEGATYVSEDPMPAGYTSVVLK